MSRAEGDAPTDPTVRGSSGERQSRGTGDGFCAISLLQLCHLHSAFGRALPYMMKRVLLWGFLIRKPSKVHTYAEFVFEELDSLTVQQYRNC